MTLMIASPPADDADRPFYLTRPCPPWCVGGHGLGHGEWGYEDRMHRSSGCDITLTAMAAIVDATAVEYGGKLSIEPRGISTCLWQHYREAEPRVSISHGDDTGEVVELALDEAERLARHLLELVALARADQ